MKSEVEEGAVSLTRRERAGERTTAPARAYMRAEWGWGSAGTLRGRLSGQAGLGHSGSSPQSDGGHAG